MGFLDSEPALSLDPWHPIRYSGTALAGPPARQAEFLCSTAPVVRHTGPATSCGASPPAEAVLRLGLRPTVRWRPLKVPENRTARPLSLRVAPLFPARPRPGQPGSEHFHGTRPHCRDSLATRRHRQDQFDDKGGGAPSRYSGEWLPGRRSERSGHVHHLYAEVIALARKSRIRASGSCSMPSSMSSLY